MTKRQKVMLEDEINTIQHKIDEAQRFMEVDNFWSQPESARRWSACVDEEVTRLDGIKIALSVLGYNIGWKDGHRIIIPAGSDDRQ